MKKILKNFFKKIVHNFYIKILKFKNKTLYRVLKIKYWNLKSFIFNTIFQNIQRQFGYFVFVFFFAFYKSKIKFFIFGSFIFWNNKASQFLRVLFQIKIKFQIFKDFFIKYRVFPCLVLNNFILSEKKFHVNIIKLIFLK